MKPFSIQKKLDGDVLRFTLSGYVDEHASFSPIDFAKRVVIDLSGVEGINSIGVKNWCQWVESIKPPMIIESENCPVIMIKTFNTILGAKPRNMIVTSLLVPYLTTDGKAKRKDVLFRLGNEYMANGTVQAPQVKDENGTDMEMDVLPVYFNFLKK